MPGMGRTRRQEFEEIDLPNLRPLPEKPYEYAIRKTARVNIDYHVEFEKHFYSVPYLLIHQEVDLRVTEHLVQVFHKGKDVAVHHAALNQVDIPLCESICLLTTNLWTKSTRTNCSLGLKT